MADPYYTNSTNLPVGYTDDMIEMVKLQEPLQTKYTGGSVCHLYLGERIMASEAKTLIKKMMGMSKIPYFSVTPTFSICKIHGYLNGNHPVCPKCPNETTK